MKTVKLNGNRCFNLKSDYVRIEMSVSIVINSFCSLLKSDYVRIEMELGWQYVNGNFVLKSDYVRIEMILEEKIHVIS